MLSRVIRSWENGNDKRILVTGSQYLYALDSRTGIPIASFGKAVNMDMSIDYNREHQIIYVPTFN